MASVLWGKDVADVYDTTAAAMFDPAVLEPAVDLLVDLVGAGAALELAVRTFEVVLVEAALVDLQPVVADLHHV